jgi:uncharacterized membrane protein
MTNPFRGATFDRRAGAAIGLGVGAAIGLLAMPFVATKTLVVGVAMALGVFIGLAVDRRLSSRERLIGAASALVVIGVAAFLVFLRN